MMNDQPDRPERPRSLSALVRLYQQKCAPRLHEYLAHFKPRKSLSFEDAIHFACVGWDGVIHDHQRLVGSVTLAQASEQLLRCADEIKTCKSFDKLLECVERNTSSIHRFGVLATYDTSLRIGAFLDLWPKVVYLHAGTKKGCKAIGVDTRRGIVEIEELPEQVRVLEPYQAEDFLCIFKDALSASGRPTDLPAAEVNRRTLSCS